MQQKHNHQLFYQLFWTPYLYWESITRHLVFNEGVLRTPLTRCRVILLCYVVQKGRKRGVFPLNRFLEHHPLIFFTIYFLLHYLLTLISKVFLHYKIYLHWIGIFFIYLAPIDKPFYFCMIFKEKKKEVYHYVYITTCTCNTRDCCSNLKYYF